MYVGNPANQNWDGVFSDAMTDCTDLVDSPDYLYALSSISGLHIFDMHNKLNFTPLATWSLPQSGIAGNFYRGLFLDEGNQRLYVAAHFNGLYILDVSDPGNPRQVGWIDPGKALSVTVAGNYAYLGDVNQLSVIDVRGPASPRLVQSVPFSPIPRAGNRRRRPEGAPGLPVCYHRPGYHSGIPDHSLDTFGKVRTRNLLIRKNGLDLKLTS